jgi:hypothetical protein
MYQGADFAQRAKHSKRKSLAWSQQVSANFAQRLSHSKDSADFAQRVCHIRKQVLIGVSL